MSEIGLETPFRIIVDDKSDLNKIINEDLFILWEELVVVLYTTKMNLYQRSKMLSI